MKNNKILFILILLLFSFVSAYPFHAVSLKANSFVVAGENVNVREKPSLDSKVMTQLYITGIVKVLKKQNKEITIGNAKGCWVYIDTGFYENNSRETTKGWVFDYYLAGLNDFKPVRSFKNAKLEFGSGDAFFRIEFHKDGTYSAMSENTYPENARKVYFKGKLYKYRRVILALDERYKACYFYHLNSTGNICWNRCCDNGGQCYP